jgi:CubicO group peptidase (beta-lactamase class C family)
MTAQTAAKHSTTPQTPPLPQAKPETLGLSPVRLQRLSDAFKREIDKGTLPGATVMVARRGQIGWFEALGKQSPEASAPMAKNTLFRIFSMTKPIVSVGIMMLMEDGHFNLNEPVAKFIPEFADQKVGVSPTITPATAWCSNSIRSHGCAAARSAMPNMPHWSRACR